MVRKSKRGLASADRSTRQRVASMGGSAYRRERGFQTMDRGVRHEISAKGGRHSHRGRRGR